MYKFDGYELSLVDLSQWDELVSHSLHGTIFHTSGWLKACARSLEKKVKIFGCFQDGQLVGGCSLFLEKKYNIIPIALSTCDMTPYGGFVLSASPGTGVHVQESFSRQIIETLIQEIKKEHCISISIQNPPDFLDIRPFTSSGWRSRVLYTYYINLGDNLESHSDHLVKKNIRKAEKNRISIESFSDISKYYSLLYETFVRKNLNPPAPECLFTDLFSFISNQNCGEMLVAKTPDDEIACAEIVIWDNRQAYCWSAVSDPRFLNSGAPSFLRFDDLKRMKARGIPKMNMMMGNVPELSQFVAHLNPTLVPYYEIRHWIFDDLPNLKS
jgi:hypothetical protein